MNWAQATFIVDADQVEPLSNILEAFLAQAITSENAGNDEFYEVAFPGIPDWKKVSVTALFDASIELDPIVSFVTAQLSDARDEIPVSVSILEDQNWERVWLDSFQPIKVGNDLWVCPSWCEPTDASARNIILDPGLAFGTGTHATTNMCLAWLAEQDLSGKTVLDYGSGSGILAIASLLAGAEHADAVDIDPMAVQACNDNAERNNVSDKMSSFLPEQLIDRGYQLVIANILAEVIIELRDTLLLHLTTDGELLLTGILNSQVHRVKQAFGEELVFREISQDHWSLLVCSRKR